MTDLDDEASRATEMLAGKAVLNVWRHRSGEVAIEFADRSRLFADARGGDIELSITGGEDSASAPISQNAELLTPPHNFAVVQLPERKYPGVVIQGDSLSSICERLELAIDGDLGEVAGLKDELDEVLRSYIEALDRRSITPPFTYRPGDGS